MKHEKIPMKMTEQTRMMTPMMNGPMSGNLKRSGLLRGQLHRNESRCLALNVRVRILSINTENHTAHCTVQQILLRWSPFRYDRNELLRMAEKALSPLIRIGLLPMITVMTRSVRDRSTTTESIMHHPWMRIMLRWSGLDALGVPAVVPPRDPFGWKAAMNSGVRPGQ